MDDEVSKKIDGCGEDIISQLPDGILSKILSYLPIKNAVATSILSPRWKDIFPFDPSLIKIDLDDSDQNESGLVSDNFVKFVDKLMKVTLRDEPCVEAFTLNCANYFSGDDDEFDGDGDDDYTKLVSWIRTIVRLRVRDLQLYLNLTSAENLFLKLNGCTSLTRLELKGNPKMNLNFIQPNFSLPTLRTLGLCDIHFDCAYAKECTLTILTNGVPVLEELSLTDCSFVCVNNNHIISQGLKTIELTNLTSDDDFDLTINTPNIEGLVMDGAVAYGYNVHDFDSLQSAYINVGPTKDQLDNFYNDNDADEELWYYETVRDVVYCSRKVRHLYLGLDVIESLYYADNLQFPEFLNLTSLSLTSIRSEGWVVLAGLLNNAPNLEQLIFEEEFELGDMGFADFERLVPSPPTCLELHLKKVEFTHFDMNEDELKLMNYFLHNGKVLEKVVRNAVLVPIKRYQGP